MRINISGFFFVIGLVSGVAVCAGSTDTLVKAIDEQRYEEAASLLSGSIDDTEYPEVKNAIAAAIERERGVLRASELLVARGIENISNLCYTVATWSAYGGIKSLQAIIVLIGLEVLLSGKTIYGADYNRLNSLRGLLPLGLSYISEKIGFFFAEYSKELIQSLYAVIKEATSKGISFVEYKYCASERLAQALKLLSAVQEREKTL